MRLHRSPAVVRLGRIVMVAALLLWGAQLVAAQKQQPATADTIQSEDSFKFRPDELFGDLRSGLAQAAARLPLAAAFGAALALPPLARATAISAAWAR